MNCKRGRLSLLPRIGIGVIFTLLALMPSMASANTASYQAYKAQVCRYSVSQPTTCEWYTQRDGTLAPVLQTMGLPYQMNLWCPGQDTCGTHSTPQTWMFSFSDYTSQTVSGITSPGTGAGGFHSVAGMGAFSCVEYSEFEEYRCSAGTGSQYSFTTIDFYF